MAKVQFTSLLQRFFPDLKPEEVEAANVKELLSKLDKIYTGLSTYLVEENGGLRKHVNIFVNGVMIKDRIHLSDKIGSNDTINIIQALSGG
ncbi:MAG: MoaD/ThiS family protein [Flavobacteriales bacterium]|nr:MoaD/ThiS family protein [Flavobacteriales bacterium]